MKEKYNKITTIKKCSKSDNNLVNLTTTMNLTNRTTLLSSEIWLNLRIMQDMRESGLKIKMFVKEKVAKSGQTGPCMKDGGWKTKLMAKEDLSMQMEMFTMVNGLMIKLMDSVFIAILMEPSMRDIGKKINNMVKDSKHGLMVLGMKDNTFRAKNMEKEDSHGLTAALIMVNLSKTILKETESTIGQMEENIMVFG